MGSHCRSAAPSRASNYRGSNMALSEKTIAEMQAGARQVAARYADLSPEQLNALTDKVRSISDRNDALKKWMQAGLVRAETMTINKQVPGVGPMLKHRTLYYVKGLDEPFEEDVMSLMFGGYPSELLIARLALAIQSLPGGDNG